MSKPTSNTSIIDQKDVKKTFVLIAKNWYWFVLFLGLSIGASVFYLYRATNFYGASAKVLIKPQKNAITDALSASLAGGGPSKDEIANEIEVLSSSSLINEVVSKLNLDVSYFIEGRLKTGEIYQGRPFLVDGKIIDWTYYGVPFYLTVVSAEKYRLNINIEGKKYSGVHKFGEPVVNDKFSLIITNDTTIINKKSVTSINETKYLFRFNERNSLVKRYQQGIQLSMDAEATVINLFIEDQVPEKAVNFIKTLTETYIANSVSVQKEINENTLSFIDSQLKDIEDILNGVESNLEQFQRQKTTMNPENEQGVLLQQKVGFENEQARLTMQLRSVDYLYEQLTSGSDATSFSPSMMGDSPDPSQGAAFVELSALQQRKTNLLFSNTPNSPVVKEIDAQISIARQNLISGVMNMRRNLVVKINSLSSQLGPISGRHESNALYHERIGEH
ncbi:MAG: hypothetical protein IPP71_05400 [Bacteroidetes bacterium]|nr:hypothetical protein [Bacteroidota bacterium]